MLAAYYTSCIEFSCAARKVATSPSMAIATTITTMNLDRKRRTRVGPLICASRITSSERFCKPLFVGLDSHKDSNVAAYSVGLGEVQSLGNIGVRERDLDRLCTRMQSKGSRVCCVYEAGPCGYGIYRHLTRKGFECMVCAPSLIARKPGARVKTDRRDAIMLVKALRMGDLTAVHVPDVTDEALREAAPAWRWYPVVEAIQALRGVQFTIAISLIAELGDLSRFEHPRQLMAWLGVTPSEHSSGGSRKLGGITKAGNRYARKALVEAAWSYRYPAKVSRIIQRRHDDLPKPITDRAWDAQLRLCSRYRRLTARGKLPTVAVVAIARELAAFIWDIARMTPVAPAH